MKQDSGKKSKQAGRWAEEIEQLRLIVLSCRLTEEKKWGKPCFTLNNNNIVLIQGFKNYCALLFFKGALLNDSHNILVKPGVNTQAARQIKFSNAKEIDNMKSALKKYIKQAIEVDKSGLKVEFKKSSEFSIPIELKDKFDKQPEFKKAFYSLTPGRQRAYLLYFSAAKQPKTRTLRIEKYLKQILNGKGIND